MNEDPFNKKLNLTTIDNSIKSMLTDAHNDSAMSDFEMARAKTIESLEKIDVSIEELMEVSKQSQHPRAYEVLAKLFDSKSNLTKQLLDLQSKIREIDEANVSTSNIDNGDVTNNNLFIGSTADMLELLKMANPKEKIIENDIDENN